MVIHSLKIKGFRKLKDVEILFGNTTFLIGHNNCGKSTTLRALEILLTNTKKLDDSDYYSVNDSDGNTSIEVDEVVLEAEFRNLPEEAKEWRGFKGRIFNYEPENATDSGLSITYRKIYTRGENVVVMLKSRNRSMKEKFTKCKLKQDFINAGIDAEILQEIFPGDETTNLTTSKNKEGLELIDDLYDVGSENGWFTNPGGFASNVLSKLPQFLLIPIDSSSNEIHANNGVLSKTLMELFSIVRESSQNYRNAQVYLEKLSKELDPSDEDSEFGKMMQDLNSVLSTVFPESKIYAEASLIDPENLKPTFNIEMSSNIRTKVENQGTGMVRAAVFGMLRFREQWIMKQKEQTQRSLLVCFEEPEIYLHPCATSQMRDAIYDLSSDSLQIVASTHSPYLIDISRKPRQVLNRFSDETTNTNVMPFNVSEKFKELQGDDKNYVKMLARIDSHIARAFFIKNVVIVEGDTEEIVIKESLSRLSKELRNNINSNFEIVKARGKASIIGLSKYFISMGIKPIVVHDKDKGNINAEKFNKPIKEIIGNNGRIVLMNNEIEDELGYTAPTSEKPFKAYNHTLAWGDKWADIPKRWRDKMIEIFGTKYLN